MEPMVGSDQTEQPRSDRKALIEHARELRLRGYISEANRTMEQVHWLALKQYSNAEESQPDPMQALERFCLRPHR